jgi:RNA 2',3'-cyclic 3'-phosphodiesterase
LKTHFFFAVPLPTNLKQKIYSSLSDLKEESFFKKWVHEEDYHITLAFLGDTPDEKLDEAKSTVKKVVNTVPSFTITTNNFGTFGKKDSPRIFWLGLEHSTQLVDLQKLVYNACIEAGFSLDKKPFKPHITVARKWNKEEAFTSEWLEGFQPEQSFTTDATEIVLYQTQLDASPKYKTICNIPLI